MKHIKLLNKKKENLPEEACWWVDYCTRKNYARCNALNDICDYDYRSGCRVYDTCYVDWN